MAPKLGPGNGILSLTIKDKAVLYAAYMPFIKHGGLFIPTNKSYTMGDEVFMLLSLMDEPEKIPVAGKVIWIIGIINDVCFSCAAPRASH